MPEAVIAIGGNHESTATAIVSALRTLRGREDTEIVQASSLYRTAPMGADSGGRFLNSACLIETSLSPLELLDVLQQLEVDHGRVRDLHWGPRTLDLDIVFYGDESIVSERLVVPHPHYWYRRFVLEPLAQICPSRVHSASGLTVAELHARVQADVFDVTLAGDVSPESLTIQFRFEFPDVRFLKSDEPLALPALGLGVWCSIDPRELPALWLQTAPDSVKPFVRDVLTAARGACHRLPPT